jgi:hypothetical protein
VALCNGQDDPSNVDHNDEEHNATLVNFCNNFGNGCLDRQRATAG